MPPPKKLPPVAKVTTVPTPPAPITDQILASDGDEVREGLPEDSNAK